VVAAGVAPDVDTLASLGGLSARLRYSGTVTHSILGAGILAALLACGYWLWQRWRAGDRASFLHALSLAALGAASHVLLDLTTTYGIALRWPFSEDVTAWNFMLLLDPLLLTVLLIALLLPGLFRLVSEEIGAKKKDGIGRGWASGALIFLALFCTARYLLHANAERILRANQYHQRGPLQAAAFADSANPFRWLGVVETEGSIEEVETAIAGGAKFDPDRSRTFYKPEASPALETARRAPTAARFLGFARFPLAVVEPTASGSRITLRDVGYSRLRNASGFVFAAVELDAQGRVVREELRFNSERAR
jgi:inner membrane protein